MTTWRIPLTAIDLGEEEVPTIEEILQSHWQAIEAVTSRV
jgi:hypothetical protein